MEELDVAREVAEQSEEVWVQCEGVAQRAGLIKVVPADALERQIEPVLDLPVASAPLVDRHLAIDAIGRKDHHPADRVADAHKLFALNFRDLIDDGRQPRKLGTTASLDNQNSPSSERW